MIKTLLNPPSKTSILNSALLSLAANPKSKAATAHKAIIAGMKGIKANKGFSASAMALAALATASAACAIAWADFAICSTVLANS